MFNLECTELKPYRGYGITRAVRVDDWGKRIPGTTVYLVDDGEDYVLEEYNTIKEAHRAIDAVLQ